MTEQLKFIPQRPLDYVPNEGKHSAILRFISYGAEAKHANCDCDKKVRFTFFLDSDPRKLVQHAAAITLCMSDLHSDELLQFLKQWLRDDLQNFMAADGSIDLEQLTGERATITIQHHPSRSGKHAKPFCKIANIAPLLDAGSLAQ